MDNININDVKTFSLMNYKYGINNASTVMIPYVCMEISRLISEKKIDVNSDTLKEDLLSLMMTEKTLNEAKELTEQMTLKNFSKINSVVIDELFKGKSYNESVKACENMSCID